MYSKFWLYPVYRWDTDWPHHGTPTFLERETAVWECTRLAQHLNVLYIEMVSPHHCPNLAIPKSTLETHHPLWSFLLTEIIRRIEIHYQLNVLVESYLNYLFYGPFCFVISFSFFVFWFSFSQLANSVTCWCITSRSQRLCWLCNCYFSQTGVQLERCCINKQQSICWLCSSVHFTKQQWTAYW